MVQALQARQVEYGMAGPVNGFEQELAALRGAVKGIRDSIYDLRAEIVDDGRGFDLAAPRVGMGV